MTLKLNKFVVRASLLKASQRKVSDIGKGLFCDIEWLYLRPGVWVAYLTMEAAACGHIEHQYPEQSLV